MVKFYSEYRSQWCLGANVKNSIGCAMTLKMNSRIIPFNVVDETTIGNLNAYEGTNFNFLVGDANENNIDFLKPKIEQFLKQNGYI